MKVEFITSYFYPFTGGIENVVIHLAEGLVKRGHTVVVHTGDTYPGKVNELKKEEIYNKILIKRYPFYPFSLFFPKIEFEDSILSLHNYSALMNDYVARKYPNHKKILTPYGTITYDRSQRKYPLLSIFYDSLLGKQTLFAMDKIVAMTNFENRSIGGKYPLLKDKTITIAGGIDMVVAKKFSKKILPERFLFSIGRIASSKRFEDVLSVLNNFKTFHYVLAGGDNGHLHTLQSLAREKGVADRFHYLGKISDAEKVYIMQKADAFVMPSSAEAFSIASVEAFCYSKKVVGAKSGGIVDVFDELGGSLYKAGDIQDLSRVLSNVLKKPVSFAILKKRKKIIEKKYTWDVIVNDYERSFKK